MLPRNLTPLLLLLLLVLFSALGLPPVLAQTRPAPAPPQPRELSVKVRRGEFVEIPLRIYGQAHQPISYVIRSAPEHGRAGALRVVEREVSALPYQPPGDLGITRDRFTYAAKSAAGVSAAVEVVIQIVDEPAQLRIPGELEFPAILAGARATREFEIVNTGGGIAKGRVTTDPPWQVEGAATYELTAGKRATVKITFAPGEPGTSDGAIRFSSHPERVTALHGEALPPVGAAPAQLPLQHVPGDPVRSGTFELVNHTEAAKSVTLSSGARVKVPATATLEPLGRRAITVLLDPADVASLEDTIVVADGVTELRVPVKAPAVPAILRATPTALVFPPMARRGTVEIENAGGTAVAASLQIAEPFHLEPAALNLGPRERKSVLITLDDGATGRHRTPLIVAAPPQKLEISVDADASARPMAATPAAAPSIARNPSEPTVEPIRATVVEESGDAGGRSVTLPDWLRDAVPVPGVSVSNVTATSATIEWPAKLGGPRFRVDRREMFVKPDGWPDFRWVTFANAQVEPAGESFRVKLSGFAPSQTEMIRVLPLNEAGEAGPRLFAAEFRTKDKPRFLPRLTATMAALGGLGLALAALVAIQIRQRFAGRSGL